MGGNRNTFRGVPVFSWDFRGRGSFQVMERRLYLRAEHGSHPVFVRRRGKKGKKREYTVRVKGDMHRFGTTRHLLRWLYGKTVYLSHDRYFGLGRYGPERVPTTSILEHFRKLPGIDLENRSTEVSKILFRCYGNTLTRLNMEVEDVLQEVFKGILSRNLGKCPWDPQKSSFGHYVHMVVGCVLLNLQKKQKRRSDRETVGVRRFSDSTWQWFDAAEAATDSFYTNSTYQETTELAESVEDLQIWLRSREDSCKTDNKIAREIVPFLCQGFKRAEIAFSLEMDPSRISRGLHYLRAVTREWAGTRPDLAPR